MSTFNLARNSQPNLRPLASHHYRSLATLSPQRTQSSPRLVDPETTDRSFHRSKTTTTVATGGQLAKYPSVAVFSPTLLHSLAERVFPEYRGLVRAAGSRDVLDDAIGGAVRIPRNRAGTIGIEISSSVPLQMLLYLNVWFLPFWWFTMLLVTNFKLTYFATGEFYAFLCRIFLGLVVIVEPIRLYLGYDGNLREKVPELTASFLLTLFPALPIAVFYVVLQTTMGGFALPIDIALNVVYLLLLLPEAIVAYLGIKYLIKAQAANFAVTVAGGEYTGFGNELDEEEEEERRKRKRKEKERERERERDGGAGVGAGGLGKMPGGSMWMLDRVASI